MPQSSHSRTVVKLVGIVLIMGALSWASVPFYNWFCKVTGFGGVTGVATAGSDKVLTQTINIRFDASLERGMPWEFKPMQREMTLKLGETGLAFYEAYNPTDHVVAGQASYNVTPYEAGGFFEKIECFCFTAQILQPGERVEMPVSFFVDPGIATDPDAKYTKVITLSYTFHEIDPSVAQAALASDTETDKTTN